MSQSDVMTKDEIEATFDIAVDMHLGFNVVMWPVYQAADGNHHEFKPLTCDTSAMLLQVQYHLSLETTEYGVFVRQTDGRMLLWKEFPRDIDLNAELVIVRRALFQAAWKVVCEKAQQAELTASS